MISLTEGINSSIVVTLAEKTTLPTPYYLFVFTHITTKAQVKFIKTLDDDLSAFSDRYNEYDVDVSLFTYTGQYLYKVYEQESATNTDEALTEGEVENGKMNLLQAVGLTRTEYTTTTTIKTYQG